MTVTRPLKRVEQTNRYNCGSACLAMVLGMSVEECERDVLKRRVGELVDPEGEIQQIGVMSDEIVTALWDRGIGCLNTIWPVPDDPLNWFDRVGDQLPILRHGERFNQHVWEGGIAIVGVVSLRYEGGQHWIVADGPVLLDPAPGDGPRYRHMSDYSEEHPLLVGQTVLIAA